MSRKKTADDRSQPRPTSGVGISARLMAQETKLHCRKCFWASTRRALSPLTLGLADQSPRIHPYLDLSPYLADPSPCRTLPRLRSRTRTLICCSESTRPTSTCPTLIGRPSSADLARPLPFDRRPLRPLHPPHDPTQDSRRCRWRRRYCLAHNLAKGRTLSSLLPWLQHLHLLQHQHSNEPRPPPPPPFIHPPS